eukprot:gb/GEZN01001750.1/.p1 GENE.gb/GEZN01001750.1/~~gb/GEZN01001750.1/.p1  ORF type:complete len:892 (+),score=89.81 gb/GEZN01001750.1/:341-2677(+)
MFLYGELDDDHGYKPLVAGAVNKPFPEVWLYGAKCLDKLAVSTGIAGDVLKGHLVCFQEVTFGGKLMAADQFHRNRMTQKGDQELRRSEGIVVKKDGTSEKAFWWSQAESAILPSAKFLARGGRPIKNLQDYHKLYNESIKEPEKFWAHIAQRDFYWEKPFDPKSVLEFNFDRTKGPIFTKWFKGGTTNLCYNALDRHVEAGQGAKIALIAERNDQFERVAQPNIYTYSQALEEVQRLANVLKKQGVKKGDVVAIFMPMVPELPLAMLACARIGALHSVVFGGFSAEALGNRLIDGKAKMIITADGVMRGKKRVELYTIADDAAEIAGEGGVVIESMIVLQRLGQRLCPVGLKQDRDFWWHEVVPVEEPNCPVVWMDAEDPLFILYTSGSTGKPKGVLHTTGGYMVNAGTTFKYVFDVQPEQGDVWFCTADCGWITGHTYVTYGPMMNGATQVIFEGLPSHPDAGRLWNIVDRQKVTSLYTAPTAIRALMKEGDRMVKSKSRSTLRLLGTVGEPINPEAWRWYHEVVGDRRCPVVDTWWQTETGAVMITPLPVEGWAQKPGSATLPFFGVQPAILDANTGKELPDGPAEGLLALKFPWPSTIRTIYGDHARMEETYFSYPGYYFTGDGCRRDEDGYYWITGRVDDVMIVSGHNIGSAEVESSLVAHPRVAEAAVVGVPHPIKGEALYCYVTLNAGVEPSEELRTTLKDKVRHDLGAFTSPDTIHWAPALPKTRSGKIMRRILRKIAALGKKVQASDLGDTSTLADPSVIDALIASYGK